MARWSTQDSVDLYGIDRWGLGLFGVNELGHITVKAGEGQFDLRRLVDDLQLRGVQLPVLVRLMDVLQSRVASLYQAFAGAAEELEYQGEYRGVYPIKVNQQRHVVEDLVEYSKPYHFGLECGSKPELLIVLAMSEDPDALVLCNGYKDSAFLEMALISRKLGRNTIVTIEQFDELEKVLAIGEQLGIDPVLGVRAKLASRGTGRWEASSGDRAKFGLTVREIVQLVAILEKRGKLHCLQLLHFHIGSQVSNIRKLRGAVREGARIYAELARMGANMQYLDVGGGLGVDYDGSRSDYASSINYQLSEYAFAVLESIRTVCEERSLKHPVVVTESGRALVAHSSLLVLPVIGVGRALDGEVPGPVQEGAPTSVGKIAEILGWVTVRNALEAYHDAVDVKDQVMRQFLTGGASLEERASVDSYFWALVQKIVTLYEADGQEVPSELTEVVAALADTYYCNFSVFQSAPDHWAIGQLFPVVPLQRLNEEPTQRGVLVDLTCDSDGKINRFIDRRDTKRVLEMHTPGDEPYYLGLFLIGAYQEILGDLHNLFGDTNAVHVQSTKNGRGYRIKGLVEGDSVTDVLSYVSYSQKQLLGKLRAAIEESLDEERLTMEEGKRLLALYRTCLDGYTYLDE
jgi:arginine decarboxylase